MLPRAVRIIWLWRLRHDAALLSRHALMPRYQHANNAPAAYITGQSPNAHINMRATVKERRHSPSTCHVSFLYQRLSSSRFDKGSQINFAGIKWCLADTLHFGDDDGRSIIASPFLPLKRDSCAASASLRCRLHTNTTVSGHATAVIYRICTHTFLFDYYLQENAAIMPKHFLTWWMMEYPRLKALCNYYVSLLGLYGLSDIGIW